MKAEQTDTPGVSELNEMSDSAFFELARLKPRDATIVKHLCERYENRGVEDFDEELTYLRIRWLNAQCRWPWLNKLAEVYVTANQKRNAYKCLVESLRENPSQEDVFNRCEQLEEYSGPAYPQKLRENKCTVSIIMCTFNRPKIMRDAVSSVLSQTFSDYELIVVNDGGPDVVEQVVRSFGDKRIKYMKLPQRRGWSAGQNKAITEASGEYIGYLDDDDVYYPDHLATMVNALKRSRYDVVYNNTKVVRGSFDDGSFITQRVAEETEKFSRERLLQSGWFGDNNIMHTKSVYFRSGLFDEDLMMATEDWDMWLRMALHFEFEYANATTTECRIRGENVSVKNRDRALFFEIIVRNFYCYYMGKIAYVKHFLACDKKEKASSLYDEISADYEDYFRSPDLIRELIGLAGYFGDGRFLKRLSRDYFMAGPRKWKKEALRYKPFEMILGALPVIPVKVCEKVAGFCRK